MEDYMKVMLGTFASLLIILVLVQVVSDQIAANTDSYSATNETVTLDANRAGNTQGVTNVVCSGVNNGTFVWDGAIGTGFNCTTAGVIAANASFVASQPVNVTYTYTNTNYVNDSTSRSLLSLVTIFSVIAVLGVSAVAIKMKFDDF